MKKALIIAVALSILGAAVAHATGARVIVLNGTRGNYISWWPSNLPNGCRVQMLLDKALIQVSGRINEFELQKYDANSASFSNVRFYLYLTNRSTLTTNFTTNYSGRTPVLVGSFSSYNVPGASGYYPIPMSTTFNYNNAYNLILEIRWSPPYSGSNCALQTGSKPGFRCWANTPSASTGTVDAVAYNARISLDYYTAVAPTSLGRIKTLYD